MILIICGFVFATIFLVLMGVQMVATVDRRAMIRRRLISDDDLSDVLDPRLLRRQHMSSVGLLNRLVTGIRPAHRLEQLLMQANVNARVVPFTMMSLGLAVGVGLATNMLFHHTMLAAFVGLTGFLVPLMIVAFRKERRIHAFNDHFPDALDMMINALKAGFALNGAIQMVADEAPDPVGQEFRILYEEQQLGLDVRQALNNLAMRVDSTDVALFVTAVLIQRETGGNLAEVLEKIAYVIRDRFRIIGEVRAFTAQGRLTGIILAGLPVLFVAAMSVMSPDYLQVMLDTHPGQVMLNVAIVLQVVGFICIRKIVNIKI